MIAQLRAAVTRLRRTEPALLRARYTQAVLLAGALGLTVPGVVDRWVGVGLAVFAFAGPWLQGRRTRADVWSPQTVNELAQLANDYPQLSLLARDLLGRGLSIGIVKQVLDLHDGDHHRAPA